MLSPKLGAEYAYMLFVLKNVRTTADTTQRFEYFQRCAQILAETCPVAPIYFYRRNHLHLPHVQGW